MTSKDIDTRQLIFTQQHSSVIMYVLFTYFELTLSTTDPNKPSSRTDNN